LSAPCVRRLSADGRGAIAVVEVRGRGALERVKALASGTALAPGELRLLALRDGDQVLDRALVAVLAEDELELHLHGNPSLVERVLAALGGETQSDTAQGLERAALELLADAPCEAAARLLLDQAEGALRRELELLLELPDEQARAGLDTLLERARVARFALRPARVLLRGPVNAGKSTLFNALHASERVLVSEQAGTTRDVVRERVQLGEWPVELWDTPGEREQGAPASRALELERAGLALARELERAADLVLWLAPAGTRAPEADFDGRLELLESRADERRDPSPGAISARTDPHGAARTVAELFRRRFALPPSAWSPGAAVPFDESQASALRSARAGPRARRVDVLQRLLAGRVDPDPDAG
jgi:tRNA modification GTPase